MNPRYTIFTQESLCNASGVPEPVASSVQEQRIGSNSRLLRSSSLSLQPSSPPFFIRLAMKISRSRWYSFLRRVFHYQNGSSSELGPNPFDTKGWMLVEFVALVVQILVTVYTLMISRDERPVWPMRIWLSGYAFGCFLSLGILVWRFLVTHRFPPGGGGADIEQQGSRHESRNLQQMQRCRATVELLFAIWFVMGNVWVFDTRFGSYRHAPKLHILCISLLAWNAVTYSFPFIVFVLLCCCVPILSSILGYNMHAASIQRGATEEQLANLPSWKYKDAECVQDMEKPPQNRQDPECCICLAKYREAEEIRQLPCDHIFHLKCVDQWLRIISCCPLCKQEIHK